MTRHLSLGSHGGCGGGGVRCTLGNEVFVKKLHRLAPTLFPSKELHEVEAAATASDDELIVPIDDQAMVL